MEPNHQPMEKQVLTSNGLLDLHSMFSTIQGEGPFVGCPSVFVRLAGCNLQCPLCDTDYTNGRMKVRPEYVRDNVQRMMPNGANLVVITGGEPFRQNIVPLVNMLLDAGYWVQIETNGTLYVEDMPFERHGLHIVCSPKTGAINRKLAPHIEALKYVLHADEIDPQDGLPLRALQHNAAPRTARPPEDFRGIIYVQPDDVQSPAANRRHLAATIQVVMKHGYRLGLQVHKIINME